MAVLQLAAGLFAVYMLARHVPLALRALRGGPEGRRPLQATVALANVLLAVAILAVAVKGLAGALIRR